MAKSGARRRVEEQARCRGSFNERETMMLIQQTRDRIKNEMISALWIHSAKAVDRYLIRAREVAS